tara:strand:- start:61 stop:1509 length:1449 start_codon:yes stop_codon:yes gene_type:complete
MAAITPTAGGSLNLTPSPQKQTLSGNYLDFAGTTDTTWAQQYLPELIEEEAEIFGNRSISGFLSQVGAEESMASDQVVWSEQGRLHLSYKGCSVSTNTFTIGTSVGTADTTNTHGIRVGQMVVVSDGAASPVIFKGYVSAVPNTTTLTILPYKVAAVANVSGFNTSSTSIRIFVFGSEFKKGDNGMSNAVNPEFKSYTNKPIIIKDKYEVSGSDTASIGWVEVSGEEGQNGYLWYLKAEGDTRSRYADYLEMACIEGVSGVPGSSTVDTELGNAGKDFGTEGLFEAIENRGHVTSGIAGTSASDDLGSFDEILKKFDEQGAIEENMLYANRSVSLAIDDMLASQNSYGSGGTSWGVFNNSEEMALNLGFAGFRRGSYDFYKSDWKYLNDATLRGQAAFDDVRGVIIPAGVSTVYDQGMGRNIKRPFLHVRYRASQADNRRLKTWITGSVGGNITSDLDAMEVHYLSERCLVVQGANNFMVLN